MDGPVRTRNQPELPPWLRAYFQDYIEAHADEVRALARSSDPDTSHEAANSLPPVVLRLIWERVLTLFFFNGPMRDEILTNRYRVMYDPDVAHSTVRTRRHELEALGLLRNTGAREEMVLSGRGSIVWDFATFVYDIIRDHENGHHE